MENNQATNIEDCLIVFPHTERTGGGSIHKLFDCVNKKNWFYVVDPTSGPNLNQVSNSCENGCSGYLGGHFTLDNFENSLCAKRCKNKYIFSVCRDPVERFTSIYKLWKRDPEWLPQISKLDRLSADSLYDLYQGSFSNRTCKQFSQLGTFESVINMIGKKISFIGTTDRLDLVVKKLMTDFAGYWPNSFAFDQKVNAGAVVVNSELENLGFFRSELIERITNDNMEDELLFRYILKQGGICNSVTA